MATPSKKFDLLAGPIIPTLVRLASPNALGLLAQTLTIGYDGYIVAQLGTAALAAVALAFPLSMLMVQLSRAAMGGGVSPAGYGIGARLEYLLIPLVFGFGAALLSMVGRNIGAGQHDRAARIAWTGSLFVAGITGVIGVLLALFPDLWTMWFAADAASPARVAANLYLRIVGAFYGPFGFGLAFFFASQGAGRLAWPLAGSFGRLAVALAGGAIAVAFQSLIALYVVIGLSFLVYALVPGFAFRVGAWAPRGETAART